MATANAIAYKKMQTDKDLKLREQKLKSKDQDLKGRELTENERANREREKIQREDIAMKDKINYDIIHDKKAGRVVEAALSFGKPLGTIISENDYSWYTKTGDALENAAKESNTAYSGVGYRSHDLIASSTDLGSANIVENTSTIKFRGGVVWFTFTPYVGNNAQYESTTAQAIRAFNTRIRGANSGATNYDAVDLFQYQIASDSLLTVVNWALRNLQFRNFSSTRSPLINKDMLLDAGCYETTMIRDAFRNHPEVILSGINKVSVTLNDLNIPYTVDWTKRHMWLASSLFGEGDLTYERYYLFNPGVYHVYDELNSKLKAYNLRQKLLVAANDGLDVANNFIKILQEMATALANSQTAATMSGDIEKAFQTKLPFPTYALDNIEAANIEVQCDTKYLMSIRNADLRQYMGFSNVLTELSEFSINQGVDDQANPILYMGQKIGTTYVGPEVLVDYETTAGNKFYRMRIDDEANRVVDYYNPNDITCEDIVYNLSFKNTIETAGGKWFVDDARSEIIVDAHVICGYSQWDTPKAPISFDKRIVRNIEVSEVDPTDNATNYVSDLYWLSNELKSFKYLPKCYYAFIIWDNFGVPTAFDDFQYALIWNGNKLRKPMDYNTFHTVQEQTTISMFVDEIKARVSARAVKGKAKGNKRKRK